MTDERKTLAWRTVLALVALLVGWTLFLGPGERARAGSSISEHVNEHNECIAGCEPEKHICCSGTETFSVSP